MYHYFRLWRLDGTWERANQGLRALVRLKAGRHAQPSAGIVDSQSVKSTGVGEVKGYDAGKKVKGRKRHLLVDTQGLVLKARVHTADIKDRDGGKLLLEPLRQEKSLPRMQHIWVDGGYNGDFAPWVTDRLGWSVEMVQRPPKPRAVWALKGAQIE